MEDQSCKISRWQLLKGELNNLEATEFAQAIQKESKDLILIDVRTAKEFATGHLRKAINIDYLAPDFWDKIEHLPANAVYYIYCQSSRRSTRACTLMKNGGFDSMNLFNLEGGLKEWQLTHPESLQVHFVQNLTQ